MNSVGVDACLFQREGAASSFHAPMGVAVSIRDREEFRRKYDDVLDDLFMKYGKNRIKTVYKAAHITKQLQDKTNDFIKELLANMTDEIQRIDVFYTYYPEGSIEEIITCGDSYPRSYKPDQFIRIIEKGYEHYCVWKYCVEYPLASNNLFEVDHFTAKITPAWDEISGLNSLSIFYSGGECNKSISISDIILRLICNTCKGRLEHENIFNCLKNHAKDTQIRSFWMGPRRDYLNNMAWRDDFNIDIRKNIQHPIFWIAWDKETGRGDEKVSLEWSEPYNEVLTRAEASFASVRFWEPKEFPLLVEKNDIIFLLNDKALPILRAIQFLSPGIRTMDLRPGDASNALPRKL
jgi:hypothetical protein